MFFIMFCKAGKNCKVYDVIFHTKTYQMGQKVNFVLSCTHCKLFVNFVHMIAVFKNLSVTWFKCY